MPPKKFLLPCEATHVAVSKGMRLLTVAISWFGYHIGNHSGQTPVIMPVPRLA